MERVKIQKKSIIPPEKNIGSMFLERVAQYGERPLLTYKFEGRWKDLSWNETAERVQDIALGLLELQLEQGHRACILADTRVEWACAYLAIASLGGICAGIYATNSPSQVAYILNDCQAAILFAENQEQVDKVLEIWDTTPHLKKVIVFERFSPKDDKRFMSLEDLVVLGRQKKARFGTGPLTERMGRVDPDDVVKIIYTSGTTGEPKGVMLAHFTLLYACKVWATRMPIGERDMGLASLPMSHVIGVLESLIWRIYYGCHICFAEDITTVFVDILDVKPTYIFTTPRFYEKYYNQIVGIIEDAPWFRRMLIDFFLDIGFKHALLKQKKDSIPLYLKCLRVIGWLILYRKIRNDFGGKI